MGYQLPETENVERINQEKIDKDFSKTDHNLLGCKDLIILQLDLITLADDSKLKIKIQNILSSEESPSKRKRWLLFTKICLI